MGTIWNYLNFQFFYPLSCSEKLIFFVNEQLQWIKDRYFLLLISIEIVFNFANKPNIYVPSDYTHIKFGGLNLFSSVSMTQFFG